MIGLPDGAEATVVGARPARLIQPLTGDAGSVVRALADAAFSGPSDDAAALALASREVRTGPPGRRAIILITTNPVPAALASAVSAQVRAANASLYVAARPKVAPSFARLASDSGGWAVTASSARSLLPAVDAIGADLAHQYRLAYTTAYPALTVTRLRVAVAGAGDDGQRRSDRAGAGRVRAAGGGSARKRAPRRSRRDVGGLADRGGAADRPAGVAIVDRRRGRREPAARDEPGSLGPMA